MERLTMNRREWIRAAKGTAILTLAYISGSIVDEHYFIAWSLMFIAGIFLTFLIKGESSAT
jgi:hypothetical protein